MKAAATMPRARIDRLVISELDDETLIYDLERDEALCLNQTAALVWKRCNGKTTIGEVAGLLQDQLRAPVDVDIVWLALKQLQRFHLIEKGAGSVVGLPPVSRRTLLLKYAPAALALPVIMSITAPTPAQAASCSAGSAVEGCPCSSNSDCASSNCNAGVCGPELKAPAG